MPSGLWQPLQRALTSGATCWCQVGVAGTPPGIIIPLPPVPPPVPPVGLPGRSLLSEQAANPAAAPAITNQRIRPGGRDIFRIA